jgi:hypothetical protein
VTPAFDASCAGAIPSERHWVSSTNSKRPPASSYRLACSTRLSAVRYETERPDVPVLEPITAPSWMGAGWTAPSRPIHCREGERCQPEKLPRGSTSTSFSVFSTCIGMIPDHCTDHQLPVRQMGVFVSTISI